MIPTNSAVLRSAFLLVVGHVLGEVKQFLTTLTFLLLLFGSTWADKMPSPKLLCYKVSSALSCCGSTSTFEKPLVGNFIEKAIRNPCGIWIYLAQWDGAQNEEWMWMPKPCKKHRKLPILLNNYVSMIFVLSLSSYLTYGACAIRFPI